MVSAENSGSESRNRPLFGTQPVPGIWSMAGRKQRTHTMVCLFFSQGLAPGKPNWKPVGQEARDMPNPQASASLCTKLGRKEPRVDHKWKMTSAHLNYFRKLSRE